MRALGFLLAWAMAMLVSAQGNENFTNIPTVTPGSYLDRSWTGTNSVTWTATKARTDQLLAAGNKAICTSGSGTVTSPVYTGGIGVLQFDYVRAFTGTSARAIGVWVNGAQIGSDITVSTSSDVVAHYSATINVGGNVSLELRTSGAQIKIDNIQWTAYVAGPTVNFNAASSTALESAGTVAVNMTISPAATASTTFTITINGSSTASYATDYSTAPAAVASTISVTVAAGATAASFNVNLVNDAITEGDEAIDFTISGATGGTLLGANVTHQFTITDDDNTPTINFSTLSITVLEDVGVAQMFALSFLPTTHPSGSLTIQINNGPGAAYTNDYNTNPVGGGGTFTISFGPNVPSLSFSATVINDLLAESTETVTFTLVSVSAGFAIGGNNTATLVIGDNDSAPTVLAPGDLAIVGVNANDNNCDGGNPADYDYVSFFCFQEITYGTEIILTDNGYERCNPGQWGNTEGTVRMRRTGPAIPAGQVVTFRFNGTSGSTNVASVAPDAGWTCTSIGVTGTAIALNVNGDQIFFLQGGTWNPGTTGNHNATYTGTLLYAFTSNPVNPWSASCTGTSEDNKRSNLPPGVECFSMAPTGASDFNKYIGPTTSATQRDWIIRIENAANWNSYPTCGLYGSSGYNWLTAPILPITPGAMVHGVWRGAINTDWFECKNWDDARVPDATTDVVINETAIRNCQVGLATGLSPGGTAVCSSLLLTSNSAVNRDLMVEPGSMLNIAHGLTVDRTAGSGPLTVYVKSGATLIGEFLRLHSVNAVVDEAVFFGAALNAVSRFSGNVTIEPGGFLNLNSPIIANFGTMYIGGDYTNQRTETAFRETYSQVVFDGSGPQGITTNSFEELFFNLRVDKPSGMLTLNNPIGVRATLDLVNGQVLSSATRLLTMKDGSNVTSVSNASFVNGPVQKVGDTPFTFPIGDNNVYRPAALSGITGGVTSAFTATYFNASPTATLGPTGLGHDATLHHVSDCEHWRIDRGNGTPNAMVTLNWQDPVSCGVTSLPDMRVGYWTGSLWTDAGGTSATGNTTAGTVSTSGVQSSFLQAANFWTLASLSDANPLPVELLYFTAQPNGSQVELKWSTASEKDNDHFTVERSADAMHFTGLLLVPGAGNSQNVIQYADTDPSPLDGLSYYRLRQTDIDGTTVVSDAVPVYFSGSKGRPLQVLYGNDGLFLLHDFAPGSTLEVMDLTGRVAGSTAITAEGLVKVPLDDMAHGVYLLRMSHGPRVESMRVAY